MDLDIGPQFDDFRLTGGADDEVLEGVHEVGAAVNRNGGFV